MFSSRQEKEFIKELSDLIDSQALGVVVQWISANLDPEGVFEEKDLQHWAENNGYVKE